MAKTLQERFTVALERLGYILLKITPRYRVYGSPKIGHQKIYLGSHGALRIGRTWHASRPIGEKVRQSLLRVAEYSVAN